MRSSMFWDAEASCPWSRRLKGSIERVNRNSRRQKASIAAGDTRIASLVSFDGLCECVWREPGNLTSRGAQYFLHDFTIIDGRALEAAVVEVGQFDVI